MADNRSIIPTEVIMNMALDRVTKVKAWIEMTSTITKQSQATIITTTIPALQSNMLESTPKSSTQVHNLFAEIIDNNNNHSHNN